MAKRFGWFFRSPAGHAAMEVREGPITIAVPELSTDGAGDAVFYNPRQERNRDITIATLRAFREREAGVETYLDGMAASGIRGARAAAEGLTVTCCDSDEAALEHCRENFERNGLSADFRHRNVNALLHEEAFDIVDLDPFGSPIPFVDAAFAGTKRLLCVTATDTAPLCGAHHEAGIRRYGVQARPTEYHREVGIRVLLSALCRTAARYDLAIEPQLSHDEGHSVRTYLTFRSGAGAADAALEQLGTISHCRTCLSRRTERGLEAAGWDTCPSCDGHEMLQIRPIWLGPTHSTEFVETVKGALDSEMATVNESKRLLGRIASELPIPTHYDQHVLCKQWGRTARSIDIFLDALEAVGASTSRTQYGGTTFKTDAGVDQIRTATAHLHESS